MTNQASIKYISSLLEHPEQISDGDHNSIALFRQTYPYFVPARYILAAEKHRKVPFTPPMLSEIQPYMGNWLMLCSFLDASTKTATQSKKSTQSTPGADNFVTNKKSVDIGRAGIGQDRKDNKPAQKMPSFIQPANANQPKAVPAEIKAEQAKALAAAMNSSTQSTENKISPVAAEVKPEPKTEAPKPAMQEVKPIAPAVAEVKETTNVEAIKPVIKEVKAAVSPVVSEVKPPVPPVVSEVKIEQKVEAAKPIIEDFKAPVSPVVSEVKPEPKVEAAKQIIEEVKAAAPPVVSEVKIEQKTEAAKPIIEEVKAAAPPVVSEVKIEQKVEAAKPIIEEIKIPVSPVVSEGKPEPKVEAARQIIEEVKSAAPPVVSEVKPEPKVEAARQIVEEVKAAAPPVVSEVKMEPKVETTKPTIEEIKATVTPVVSEVKVEPKVEAAKQVVEEVNAVVPPVVTEVIQDPRAEAAKVFEELKSTFPVMTGEIKTEPAGDAVMPLAEDIKPYISKDAATSNAAVVNAEAVKQENPVYTEQKQVLATKLIPVKVTLDNKNEDEGAVVVPQLSEPKDDSSNSELISPVYTEDYFLQQGLKVSEAIPEEIEELKDVPEEDDEDKSLMVMMSFSEWLLHFKNTTEKQKEEKKDQKALKTMWQKEKLAAAMEEENEEIPENVFEMAVNSITKEDGLASESLADIYIKQGKYDKAIEMYRKLSLRNPKKNAYFARRIEEVLKEKQS